MMPLKDRAVPKIINFAHLESKLLFKERECGSCRLEEALSPSTRITVPQVGAFPRGCNTA